MANRGLKIILFTIRTVILKISTVYLIVNLKQMILDTFKKFAVKDAKYMLSN